MSHNPNEDDNETCVPEIITGSRSLSFDESKVDEREADDMIFIGSIEEEKNLVIRVYDTGIGINYED